MTQTQVMVKVKWITVEAVDNSSLWEGKEVVVAVVTVYSKDVAVHIIKKLLQHAKQASNKVTSQTIEIIL